MILSKPDPIDAHIKIDGKIPIIVPIMKFFFWTLNKTATRFEIPNGIPTKILYNTKDISSLLWNFPLIFEYLFLNKLLRFLLNKYCAEIYNRVAPVVRPMSEMTVPRYEPNIIPEKIPIGALKPRKKAQSRAKIIIARDVMRVLFCEISMNDSFKINKNSRDIISCSENPLKIMTINVIIQNKYIDRIIFLLLFIIIFILENLFIILG